MKTYTHYFIGSIAVLLLLFFGVTVVAAQGGGGGGGSSSGGGGGSSGGSSQGQGIQEQDRDQDRDRDQIRDPSTHVGTNTTPDQDRDRLRDQDRLRINSTTVISTTSDEIRDRDRDRDRLHINLENVTVPAGSVAQLREMLQNREQELNREAASGTTTKEQNSIRNTNQVRLAVHALLAAKNLLGGIGPEVSRIATEINNSVQATLNNEFQLQTRGFWSKFFFGGDRANAKTLEQYIVQNQERVRELQQLINTASTTPEVREMLQEHIRNMEQEYNRLYALAQQEQLLWGLFSWRF